MPLLLNKDNYYSPQADQEYMSHSQYLNFIDCEARAMAIINREWQQEPTEEMLVGSFLHAWNEGTLEQFALENPDIISSKGPTKGQLKAKFLFAQQMIDTLQSDPLCMLALEGEKELIMTGEFAGAPWKIKIDSYKRDKRRLVDLKTTRSITDLVWSNERWAKVGFIEAYHYTMQMAIYSEIERQNANSPNWPEPLIVAVSKETPPDKAIISLNDPAMIRRELNMIDANMPRILEVKAGLEKPERCERCEYCRSTKKLSSVMFYRDLEGGI